MLKYDSLPDDLVSHGQNKCCLSCLLVPGLHSSAWQTTCLLIPVNAPLLSGAPPHLELLERLLGGGCHLVAGRMSLLDPEQRRHIAETLMSSRGEEGVRRPSLNRLALELIVLQWWSLSIYIYSSTVVKYNPEELNLLKYCNICYFLYYTLDRNIVLFTSLHIFDIFVSYYFGFRLLMQNIKIMMH